MKRPRVAFDGARVSVRRRLAPFTAILGLLALSAALGAVALAVRGGPGAGFGRAGTDDVAYALALEAVDLQAQRPATQVAERMGPFEYTVNSVLGRYLNVPGTD